MAKQSSLLTALTLLVSAALPNARGDAVDDYIGKQMRLQHIPGLSLTVIRDGTIIKSQGYGMANVETRTPATPETVYQLCSVTKQFTATAILLLVQDGKIGLDDHVDKYLDGMPETWRNITIRHLLTHTSGIKDYLAECGPVSREDTTPEKIIGLVTGRPLNFAPGERFSYCNTGYVMLFMIVQKISGQPYDAFLSERVFKPSGMNVTCRSAIGDIVPNRASGYSWVGGGLKNGPYLNPTVWDNGDGGMFSSVLDLAKWDAALEGKAILSNGTKQLMWPAGTPNDGKLSNSAFGWAAGSVQGHRVIESNGGRPGAAAYISRYMDDKITIILLMNTIGNTTRITRGVARRYIPSLNPVGPTAKRVEARLLVAYTGRYEFANNSMLTITREGDKLIDHSPRVAGGYWLPVSETTFSSEDIPVQITFDKDAAGYSQRVGLEDRVRREKGPPHRSAIRRPRAANRSEPQTNRLDSHCRGGYR